MRWIRFRLSRWLHFKIIWANEIDKDFCKTYRANFSHDIREDDIRDVLYKDTLNSTQPLPQCADIVLGGFPCQDFSHAGKRRGFRNENGRGLLYKSMVEVVRRTRPLIFVAENVKGLLTMNKGQAIATIIKDFKKLGYHVAPNLYLAAEHGVPQMMERVILVGTDKKRLRPFEHNLAKLNKGEWITLRQAIGDLENMPEGAMENHYWSKSKLFPGTQGNSVVSPDKPGPTMRAEHHGNIEFPLEWKTATIGTRSSTHSNISRYFHFLSFNKHRQCFFNWRRAYLLIHTP